MTESRPCTALNCQQPAITELAGRALCREHFITGCYEQIEHYQRQVHEHAFREAMTGNLRDFLLCCSREAIDLAQRLDDLENLERARLLDILMRAAELARYLRRSPRREVVIPLQLRCEKLGHAWEEDVQTRVLSRHGALLYCRHEVETGDTLLVVRRDTARQTRARVAWCQRRPGDEYEIGIELLNCDNFWDLDWTDADSAAHEPQIAPHLSYAPSGERSRPAGAVRPPSGPSTR
jgi:hypothetical protein